MKTPLKVEFDEEASAIGINDCWEETVLVSKAIGRLRATLEEDEVVQQVSNARLSSLEKHFHELTIPYENSEFEAVSFRFWTYADKPKRANQIRFECKPDWEAWAKFYSISELAEALSEAARALANPNLKYYQEDEDNVSNGFGILCPMGHLKQTLAEALNSSGLLLNRVYTKAQELLFASYRKNSVTAFFSFPPELRSASEQYLLYFVQFLRDLGIKAHAEIKEDARKVLFSVTPEDGPAALNAIREALEIYLKLPGMPDFGTAAAEYPDMAVQQLRSNLLHYESQLILAKATMQTQQATIESLQLSNYQYKHLLTSSEEKAKTPEAEPVIGDTVHVVPIQGKGFKVDLPLILRRLKRVLGLGHPQAPAANPQRLLPDREQN